MARTIQTARKKTKEKAPRMQLPTSSKAVIPRDKIQKKKKKESSSSSSSDDSAPPRFAAKLRKKWEDNCPPNYSGYGLGCPVDTTPKLNRLKKAVTMIGSFPFDELNSTIHDKRLFECYDKYFVKALENSYHGKKPENIQLVESMEESLKTFMASDQYQHWKQIFTQVSFEIPEYQEALQKLREASQQRYEHDRQLREHERKVADLERQIEQVKKEMEEFHVAVQDHHTRVDEARKQVDLLELIPQK